MDKNKTLQLIRHKLITKNNLIIRLFFKNQGVVVFVKLN